MPKGRKQLVVATDGPEQQKQQSFEIANDAFTSKVSAPLSDSDSGEVQ